MWFPIICIQRIQVHINFLVYNIKIDQIIGHTAIKNLNSIIFNQTS